MYKHIVLGGTFDGLHTGHTTFLKTAFDQASHVTIGLTSERYIKWFKKNKQVSPYSIRYQALTTWLRRVGVAERTMIVPLHDRHGPAVMADMFDALAVTSDNRFVGQEINRLRGEQGLPLLTLVEVDLVSAEDHASISSTRIRNGEIDTKGRLSMPGYLRSELQNPLGKTLTGDEIRTSIEKNRDAITIAVGDRTTQTFFSVGVQPSLAIIDLLVERKPFQSFEAYKFPKKYRVIRLISGPGYIAKKAIQAIHVWSKTVRIRSVIVVDGEEDLLALPAIIHAPVGSFVYYGQPNGRLWENGPVYRGGLVEVTVTPEKKKQAVELLSRFL